VKLDRRGTVVTLLTAEEKLAEHGTKLYQINDWKYYCKMLILRSARVLARDKSVFTWETLAPI